MKNIKTILKVYILCNEKGRLMFTELGKCGCGKGSMSGVGCGHELYIRFKSEMSVGIQVHILPR